MASSEVDVSVTVGNSDDETLVSTAMGSVVDSVALELGVSVSELRVVVSDALEGLSVKTPMGSETAALGSTVPLGVVGCPMMVLETTSGVGRALGSVLDDAVGRALTPTWPCAPTMASIASASRAHADARRLGPACRARLLAMVYKCDADQSRLRSTFYWCVLCWAKSAVCVAMELISAHPNSSREKNR